MNVEFLDLTTRVVQMAKCVEELTECVYVISLLQYYVFFPVTAKEVDYVNRI